MLGEPGAAILTLAPMAAYSRNGETLLAASVANPLVDAALCQEQSAVQLRKWFPDLSFRHLKSYDIPQALPVEESDLRRSPRLAEGLFVCGDHRQSGSIQGALVSGELAAEALVGL